MLCLRDYEVAAIESILKRLIFPLGYEAEFGRSHPHVGFIPSNECFTSRDLNNFVPARKEAFVKKTLGIEG